MNRPEDLLEVVSRECYECHRPMIGRRENYQYTEAGLKSVTLTNVLVFHCKCGAIVAEIPAVGELHTLIADNLFRKKTILSGEEARFLRKYAGYSATDLAEVTGYSRSIISRWENDKKKIGKEPDRLLRLVVFGRVLQNLVGEDVKGLANRMAEAGRRVRSLNLPELLRHVEDRCEGSTPIRIDPSVADPCSTVQ